MKKIILGAVIVVIIAVGAYAINKNFSREDVLKTEETKKDEQTKVVAEVPKTEETKKVDEEIIDNTKTVIGTSVENRQIAAYHYGTGDKELLFMEYCTCCV